MNSGRTDQTVGTYLMELDVLREQAESWMVTGSGFPHGFLSALCVRNTALSKNGKSPALASTRNTLAFPEVACRLRRLLGPRGSAARQDVLAAGDLGTASEEGDFEAWVAYRKAEKEEKKERGSEDPGETGWTKRKKGGLTTNALNRKTGERNRPYTCKT